MKKVFSRNRENTRTQDENGEDALELESLDSKGKGLTNVIKHVKNYTRNASGSDDNASGSKHSTSKSDDNASGSKHSTSKSDDNASESGDPEYMRIIREWQRRKSTHERGTGS